MKFDTGAKEHTIGIRQRDKCQNQCSKVMKGINDEEMLDFADDKKSFTTCSRFNEFMPLRRKPMEQQASCNVSTK